MAGMRRGSFVLLGAVAVLGMAAAAWILVGPHLRRETVTIVSLLPRQGGTKTATDAIVQGIRLALEEHGHRAGRFKVRHEELDYSIGSGGMVALGAQAERHFATAHGRPDVLAVIGAYDSASSFRVLTTTPVGPPLLMISPSSTRSDLTDHEGRDYFRLLGGLPSAGEISDLPYFFRTLPARPAAGTLAARWAKRQGMKRAHLYQEDRNPHPELLAAFRKEAEREGIVVTESAEVEAAEMARVQARENPDLVFMTGTDPEVAADVIGFLRLAGYRGKVLLGSGSLEPSLLSALADPGEVYVTDSVAPAPPEFARRAGTSDPFAYYGYLAAQAALEAIAKADSKDRIAVVRACGRLPVFAPEGEWAQPAISLHRVANGRFEFVEVLR